MRVELEHGPIRLGRRQVVRIRDGAGRRICVREGVVWITEASEPTDIVLEPGGCYALKRDGLALVTGLDDAFVTLH